MVKNFIRQRRWLSLLMATLFVVTAGVWMQVGSATENIGPQIGNQAPDFTLNTPAAENINLYHLMKENQVTLVNFWGIWCPYCVDEIPEFVKFYQQYHHRQVEVLAVNVGDNPKDVPPFAKKNKMIFPVVIDKSNTVNSRYQISGFPTTFIIDRQGKIRDIIIGATNSSILAAKVEMVLKEK